MRVGCSTMDLSDGTSIPSRFTRSGHTMTNKYFIEETKTSCFGRTRLTCDLFFFFMLRQVQSIIVAPQKKSIVDSHPGLVDVSQ